METGLKLDPADSRARRDLADMKAEAGKYDQAGQIYADLLVLILTTLICTLDWGACLLKQRKFAEAEQELIKAIKLKPSGEAYGELAVAANENKDYPLAIQAADLRAKYLPENPMSYFLRATAYDHLRDAKDAARYYHQFLSVAGANIPIRSGRRSIG